MLHQHHRPAHHPAAAVSGVGTSNWCGATFVATLAVDVIASAPGIFAPSR